MDVSSLNLALPTAGDTALEWVHVLPAGSFRGATGAQTYHMPDPAKVIAASMTAGKLPFDENHSTQRAHATGSPSPARGWIDRLESRADGIWAHVDWNADGTALMTGKAYRYVSPVFGYARDGTVTHLISAALTNDPNLQLTALHTNPGDTMDKKAIRVALGLAEAADDAAVLTALQTAGAAAAELASAKATVTRLEGEIATLKAGTSPVAEKAALQTNVSTMEPEIATGKATAVIDAAIKAGKPILPVRAQLIAQHCANPVATEEMVNGLISINAGGMKTVPMPGAGGGVAEMTADEAKVCAAMGLKPEQYLATKRKAMTTEGSAA